MILTDFDWKPARLWPVLTEDRHLRIVASVRERGFVTVAELCSILAVSEATIRRDLDTLSREGLLRRLRGGAGDLGGSIQPERDLRHFAEVAQSAPAAKQAIARRAATLIEDGDVVGLDSGTTVAALAPLLAERQITVVTSSLAVVQALESAPAVDLMVVGGIVRSTYRSMVGTWAESMLRQVRLDKAFLGTSGVSLDGTVLDTTPSEVPIKRGLMASSERCYLMADAEKFPGSGFLSVCHVTRFDALITDRDPHLLLDNDSSVEVFLG